MGLKAVQQLESGAMCMRAPAGCRPVAGELNANDGAVLLRDEKHVRLELWARTNARRARAAAARTRARTGEAAPIAHGAHGRAAHRRSLCVARRARAECRKQLRQLRTGQLECTRALFQRRDCRVGLATAMSGKGLPNASCSGSVQAAWRCTTASHTRSRAARRRGRADSTWGRARTRLAGRHAL